MTSIYFVPTIKDILGGGDSDVDRGVGSDDDRGVDSDDGDICYLEKFREYYVDNIAIMYYKPGIFNCEYNKQTYLKDRMIISENSNGIFDDYASSHSRGRVSHISGHSRSNSSGFFSEHSGHEEPLEEPLEEQLEKPSPAIIEKAKSASIGIANRGRNTCFINSLFQMLSYIPEWYVLLSHSRIQPYMKELKNNLYDLIKDKSTRRSISLQNVFRYLKDIYPRYVQQSQDDPATYLYYILDHHIQFKKIFNIQKKEIFKCTHGSVINANNSDMIVESVIPSIQITTINDKSISELVKIDSNMQLVDNAKKEQCKRSESSAPNNGYGPFSREYKYTFTDTLYLIICLMRGMTPNEMYERDLELALESNFGDDYKTQDQQDQQKIQDFINNFRDGYINVERAEITTYNINLDYHLNIQETNFTLEGFIVKSGTSDTGHYIYIKILDEHGNYRIHDDERVNKGDGSYNSVEDYRRYATLLLYKKVT
jgi:hypothetical protein